jgi:hypothetical protein
MSNNARVVVGGEIGAAQYFQALAGWTPAAITILFSEAGVRYLKPGSGEWSAG